LIPDVPKGVLVVGPILESKMKQKFAIAAIVMLATAAVGLAGCSGSDSPSAPSSPGVSGPSANVTVNIVGNTGSQSFNPNPVNVPVGQTLAFRNSTSETHRIVQDGGGFDSGNIAPGSTSSLLAGTALITVSTGGTMTFHCTIHPSMVGSINGAAPTGGASADPDPGSGGGSGGTGDGY
jgi:plastocyanin